jgi:uncharacterized protein YjbI with pentapeptide repeats
MASVEHLTIIRQGVKTWNDWRQKNPGLIPDLSEAYLYKEYLSKANLRGADLTGANLRGAFLIEANLSGTHLYGADLGSANLSEANLDTAYLIEANLSEANLSRANLRGARLSSARLSKTDLSGAILSGVDLRGAYLIEANLSGAQLDEADLSGANLGEANLRGANLSAALLNGALLHRSKLNDANLRGAVLFGSVLIETDLCGASLAECRVYGASIWDIKMNDQTSQQNLAITPSGASQAITVDNIKVAQFIYLLLNNQEIRDVIDTITSRAVLILGRFSPERKIILDRLREELRTRRYVPIMFDFEKPKSRDTIETIRTLAGMAKFIIADLTEAKAVVQELQAIVPNLPSVVVRFIIMKAEREPGMFDHIRRFPWVIDGAFEYENADEVINSIPIGIIDPVEKRLRELAHQ